MQKNKIEDQFWLYVIISLLLHILVFVIFTYGLPSLFKSPPEPEVVTFDILPIDALSNVKTQKVQKDKMQIEDNAKKIEKTKQDEVEDNNKEKLKSEENKEELKRDFDEKKPSDKRELVSIKSKKEEAKKDKIKKSDKAQEKQVKEKPKQKKKKVPTDKEMDALLKTLEQASEGKEQKSNKRAVSAKSDATQESMGNYDENLQLSISEKHAIKQQIERNWNVPIGIQNAGEISVTLYISFKIDGTVEQVKIMDVICPTNMQIACKAASDSAVRAVWKASPLSDLPVDRYQSWKEVQMTFDPSEILGM